MISGILLAAGNSKRMGEENKLLLPINGQPLFVNLVKALEQSQLDELVVVLGHDYKVMMDLCKSSRLKLAVNGNHLDGQTTSIKVGMQLLNPSTNAVMICLCDMPLIDHKHLDAMIDSYQDDTILRPMNGNKPGNPTIFPGSLFQAIMECEDMNGCQSVIKANTAKLVTYETQDPAYFKDIDTPEEYAKFVL
ncbi:nucleotidyltransferase family protein [Portibacter marinus]|uniref:nucleotidyltransferase family protein n=1 Tax=Portibacter marinus TaxID=2898660 RepID=UPI001F2EEF24|nr:nucleotidyltransferase family protein [Portibacter marinus]